MNKIKFKMFQANSITDIGSILEDFCNSKEVVRFMDCKFSVHERLVSMLVIYVGRD